MEGATADHATPAVSIEGEATAVEAAMLMLSEDVGSLAVVDGGEHIGIVTERDLIAHVLSKGLDAQDVRVIDVCTTVEEITEI